MTIIPKSRFPQPPLYPAIRYLVVDYTQKFYLRQTMLDSARLAGRPRPDTTDLDEELMRAGIRIAWHLRQFVSDKPLHN